MTGTSYSYRPIGIVRTPYAKRIDAPHQATVVAGTETGSPAEATLELDASLPESVLRDLDGFARIWLIFAFHLSEGWVPLVQPPRGPKAKRGVLATRSPHRPNAIGLSAVELVAIEGRTLHLRGVDLLDGTPVLDLKPYVPYADAFPGSHAGWIDAVDASTGAHSAPGPRRPRNPSTEQDAYDRLGYRNLIAWPERFRREAPLLQRVLALSPSRQVLDLGCGSGEHTRFLKSLGFEATGVDASPAQLEAARAADPEGRYLQVGLTELEGAILAPQGAGICLGNTLPHLCEEANLHAFFAGLAACLLPGAPLLLQLLNYDRVLDRSERTLPLLVRPGEAEGESTVFLRLMTHLGGGRLSFTPATLRYRPGCAVPLELMAAQEVPLRGWRRAEVEAALRVAGFQISEVLGTVTGEAWSALSSDLVVVAMRNRPS